jgi:NAD(P)-dependent dehydrogenase (short-subunit alcohol dehydrogenase family)
VSPPANPYLGRFSGRTAVITGGASGLGKAVATRIVAEGGQVCLWDLDAEGLKAAAAEVGAAHVVALDVSDQAAVSAAAKSSNDALGGGSTSWWPRPASPAPPLRSTSTRSTAGGG